MAFYRQSWAARVKYPNVYGVLESPVKMTGIPPTNLFFSFRKPKFSVSSQEPGDVERI